MVAMALKLFKGFLSKWFRNYMSAFASAAANLTLIQYLLQNNKKYNAWTITDVDAVAHAI